jgi:NMD protein affecting ribosome stability and mRNA decay
MLSKTECPRCGGLSASFVKGVCRACYMRDYHQERAAAAVTQCPKCGVASANFVRGVCRACYMRDYHQRGAAAAAKDKQMVFETATLGGRGGQRLCVECEAPRIYARGLCVNCYMRGYMRDRQRQRRLLCVECGDPETYFRGLCRNCYVLDHHQRQRFCVECGAPGVYARSLCNNCYMRGRRRDHRMKLRACAVCGVSFQSVRRDALYCSLSCSQKAHRASKTQLSPKAANVGERGAVQSAIEMQGATLAPCIEVEAYAVADRDRRQTDSTIEEAATCGRTGAALSAIDGQRKARQMLASGRRDASILAEVKAECATLGAEGQQVEAEAAPIRDVAEPIGAETDGEWGIRWLLALMMLCCDPPAILLAAAASARNRPQSDAALPKVMGDVLQVAD